MSLFLKPGTTTIDFDGEELEVRVLSGMQLVEFEGIGLKINRMIKGRTDDEDLDIDLGLEIQRLNYQVLKMGLVDVSPDDIDPRRWGGLVGAIWKANRVSEDDAKN